MKTDQDRAWAELPLQIEPVVQSFFNSSITVSVGDGNLAFFWTDNWLDDQAIVTWAPTLCKAVSKRIRKTQTVAQALADRRWIREIRGGLSVQAIVEYLQLWNRFESVQLQNGVSDKIIWRWTASGEYSAKSAYNMLRQGSIPLHGHKLIWKAWAPLKVKLFLWLTFKRQHWTADRRFRHGIADTVARCYLCDQETETSEHLFIFCYFTKQLWTTILAAFGKPCPIPRDSSSLQERWEQLRLLWTSDHRRGFDTLFSLVTWELWKERNARIFRGACLQHDQTGFEDPRGG
ncbi:hypothetical protein PAHAL_1G065700 [Panicum hallii]|uniref:Reverse transcriptase zinc-binding domain-containing protein n=1 Tax=Panicum hallii TaxID=206008 RepID=A0A2T8KU69_9POAL|nr:hypothetical protein PAHAL_1G065700 [Panicum hallii]